MMKGKTIVDTEKLQELLKLVRAFEDQLSAAEIATENGELMASDLSERMAETKEDYMKKHEYKALRELRKPSRAKKLKPFFPEADRQRIYSRAISGTGLTSFEHSWTSATERAALQEL